MRCRFGACELDVERRELRVDGKVRPLQPQVFDLLVYLVRNRDRVVEKGELLRELWRDAVVTDASLQRAVSVARRALLPDRKLVRTFARRGYRFVGDVTELEPDRVTAVQQEPPRYARSGDIFIAYRTFGRSRSRFTRRSRGQGSTRRRWTTW